MVWVQKNECQQFLVFFPFWIQKFTLNRALNLIQVLCDKETNYIMLSLNILIYKTVII